MPINPTDLIGLKCSFEHNGKRVTGIITDAKPAEPFGKGRIPDFSVTVRGASGRTLTVSMCESYMSLPDS